MDSMDDGQLTRAVSAAYEKMTPMERSEIDALALEFSETVKKSHPKAMLGRESAIELLGKLGVLLVKSEVHTNIYNDGGGTGLPNHPVDHLVKWNPSPIWNAIK